MNVIIIHGSNFKDNEKMKDKDFVPQNKRHWIPWIKKELEKREIKTFTPLMPRNWDPKYEDWKNELEKTEIDEDSILVGTSAGAAFSVRWLAGTKKKIKKLILVAPVTGKEKCNEWLKNLGNFEINPKIRDLVNETVIFVSDNDKDERLKSAEDYRNKLGARLIELEGRGHFIENHMGGKEFPELLEEILK